MEILFRAWIVARQREPLGAFAALFSIFLLAGSAWAQSNAQGYLYGNVPGTSGTVSAVSTETGFTIEVGVSGSGTYRIDSLPVGRYSVTYTAGDVKTSKSALVYLNKGTQVSFAAEPARLDDIVVSGVDAALVDTLSTETSTSFSAAELERIPVQRTLTAVQLLAPDAVEGSSDFTNQQGNRLVTFGGASPLENQFFINGFNITDFRNGLGAAEVPFEFFREINIRTGGYSAEFGRSMGGSISTVSKTGANEFRAGANIFWEPDFGREDYPDVFIRGGEPKFINSKDQRDKYEANIFASGPIIRDKLFFYGLVGTPYLNTENLTTGGSGFAELESDSPAYWAANLLYNIAYGHQLQLTAFSDERDYTTSTSAYDLETGTRTSTPLDGVTEETFGGQNYIINYTGQLTDWMALNLLYGKGERKEIATSRSASGTPCSAIVDRRGSGSSRLGCIPATAREQNIIDTREAYRFDTTFTFDAYGFHQLKIGYDREDLETDYTLAYAGDGTVYTYDTCESVDGCDLQGQTVTQGTEYVNLRSFGFAGVFENKLTAYYLQDSWQVTPRLLVDLGVRYDEFDLHDAFGDSYLTLEDNWAPRLGASYDLFGDGDSKVYANYGKYFLPIVTNLAARALAIGEDRTTNYTYDSIDDNGFPTGLQQVGNSFADVGSGDQAYDQNIKATELDEFIIGFETEVAPRWVLGVSASHRNLIEAQEDTCYFDAVSGQYGCVLLNPGASPFIDGQDFDFDGEPDTLTISNDTLMLPEAKRKYYAVQVDLQRFFDGKWEAYFSYTWSHLYGNFEGFANSDVGQDDAGITITFDNFALVADGDLPNDRRHNLKARGSYAPTDEWRFGASFQLQSGRPKNAFGLIPLGTPGFDADPALNNAVIGLYNGAYEGEFAYVNGQQVGRGSEGRLSWTFTLDLSANYAPGALPGLTIGLDLFNVTNEDEVTNIIEEYELQSGQNPEYGTPRTASSFQTPRTVRLSARYEFGL